MKKPIQNQKGIALVTTLVLLVLGFAVVAILIRLTTLQSKLTSLEQGYTAALDVAKAGADDFIYNSQVCLNNNSVGSSNPCASPPTGFGTLNGSGATSCLYMKLFNNTASWATSATAGWNTAQCGAQTQASASDNTNIQQYPDITVTLGNYTAYVKIINTYLTAAPLQSTDPCYPNGCYYYTVVSQVAGNGSAQVQFIYRYSR